MGKESLQRFISKLDSKEASLRVRAVEAMSAFDFDDVLNYLSQAIEDADPSVRRQAATTLGTFNDYRAVAPLIKAMKDVSPMVREAVAQSFRKIAAMSGGSSPARSLEELSEEILNEGVASESQSRQSSKSSQEESDSFRRWVEWAADHLNEELASTEDTSQSRHTVTCGKCGELLELPKLPRFCPNCGQPIAA